VAKRFIMTNVLLYAFFENSSTLIGETGLPATVDVYRVKKSDLTSSKVVDNQAMTEIGGGLYAYRFSSGDLAIYDYLAVGKTVSADVVSKQVPAIRWNDVTPTLAVSATDAESLSDNQVAINQSYKAEISITSTLADDLGAATKLWFAVKRDKRNADDVSVVFIEKTDGLTRLNEEAYSTAAHGTIAVTGSSGAWVITITLEQAAAALLSLFGTFPMEVKAIVSSDTVFVSGGTAVVSRRVVQSLS
jgi:hypothetical protein